MKISCHSCQAKYTIADDKVAGKTVKIKCKKCSATIVVHGDQAPESRQPAQTMDQSHLLGNAAEEDAATRVFAEGQGDPGGGGADEWTVNVTDDDQRNMSTAQVIDGFRSGALTNDTYVWRDGMTDWLPITGVPELMAMLGGSNTQTEMGLGSTVAMNQPSPVASLGGTLAMNEPTASPFAARGAAVAAKKPGRAGAVDLFGAQAEPSPSMSNAPPGADKLVGERNENSVLFSLSALTATENAARVQKPEARPERASPGRNNGGRAGMDDIMNLGGGLAAAPMLAPPPLLAPVIEAPPPPPVMAMPSAMPNPAYMAGPMSVQQPQKSKAGIIIALVVALISVGGVAIFFATRPAPAPDATAKADQAGTTAAVAANTGAAPQPSAAPTAPATAAAAADTGAPAAAADTGSPASTGSPATGGPGPGGKLTGKMPDKKEAEKEKPAEKVAEKAAEKPAEKAAEAPAAGGGGAEFNRSAAMSALSSASGAAHRCAKPDGPTGGGRVKVTFAPSGNVTSAVIEGPPFAGSAVGGCVAGAFRGAHVPPFDGSPVVVTKSFSIN